MDQQIRLMGLQLALEWVKTKDPAKYNFNEQDVIDAAKKFVDYVEGSGLAATPSMFSPPPHGFFGPGDH